MRRTTMIAIAAGFTVIATGLSSVRAQRTSLRSAKSNQLSLHLATTAPTPGYTAMAVRRGDVVFVAPRGALSRAEITSVAITDSRNGRDVVLSLTESAAARLAGLMEKTAIDRLAIMTGGKLLAAGAVELDAVGGRAVLSGLSAAQAGRVAREFDRVEAVPTGPTITVTTRKPLLQRGETVLVDVFVNQVSDLRTYQVSLAITGGDSGTLKLADATIENDRSDGVFGGLQKIGGADAVGGRVGGVLFEGGVDVTTPAYLGTFTLVASDDAGGTFYVNARTDDSSLLWNSRNVPITFSTGRATMISVGRATRGVTSR